MISSLKQKTSKEIKNISSSNGGKKSAQIKNSNLMQKKEQESDAMLPSKAIKSSFEKNVLASSRTLVASNARLKNPKDKKVLKLAGMNLMGSGIKFVANAEELIGENKQDKKTLKRLLPFMAASKKSFSNIHLDSMENDKYEKSKDNIVTDSKDMVDNMRIGIIKSGLKNYGVSNTTKKYQARLKRLARSMKSFESTHSDKMPLMGIEGAS